MRPFGRFLDEVNKKNNPLEWNQPDYPHLSPQFYTIESGDTLESIAQKIYGDVDAAETIARMNNLASMQHALKAGLILRMPFYVSMYNQANDARPYAQFRDIVLGHLSPHIITPLVTVMQKKKKHHDNFFHKLIKIIAVVIVIAVAQGLAPYVVASGVFAGLGISNATAGAIATSVLAAIGDASVQGVAIGLGMQPKFSMAEVLETGVGAGVASGLDGLKIADPIEVAKRVIELSASQVATQWIEMKAGK